MLPRVDVGGGIDVDMAVVMYCSVMTMAPMSGRGARHWRGRDGRADKPRHKGWESSATSYLLKLLDGHVNRYVDNGATLQPPCTIHTTLYLVVLERDENA